MKKNPLIGLLLAICFQINAQLGIGNPSVHFCIVSSDIGILIQMGV
jgi:hypothetical protein